MAKVVSQGWIVNEKPPAGNGRQPKNKSRYGSLTSVLHYPILTPTAPNNRNSTGYEPRWTKVGRTSQREKYEADRGTAKVKMLFGGRSIEAGDGARNTPPLLLVRRKRSGK